MGPAGCVAGKLTGAKFAALVEDALFSGNAKGYRVKAEQLAKEMAKDDGVKAFVAICDGLVGK